MKKILQYIGKGRWNENLSKKKKSPVVYKSKKRALKDERIIENIKSSIDSSGYRSTKISSLYKNFGYKRRGTSNTEYIKTLISDNELFCYPELDDVNNKWNSVIQIFSFPVEKIGDLFEYEVDLEEFVDKNHALEQLGINEVKRQYSPKRTKDKLDFKGSNKKHNIVIELKHKGGGKSAVEQVLRYAGMLRQEDSKKPIRKILITGIRGLPTAKAFYGMNQEQKQNFEWYLYKYNKKKKTIRFERVSNEYIKSKLQIL